MLKKALLFISLSIFIITLAIFPFKKDVASSFHSSKELADLKFMLNHKSFERAPIDSDQYFLTSFRCRGCHGYDPLHIGSTINDTVDVNLYDDWEATMMALSAKDPLWRAKVEQEILTNPSHSLELQTKCTSCHAPMGHYTAIYKGMQHYTLEDLELDSLGLNGVACGGCHSIGSPLLGTVFSGNIPYDTTKKEYGPFTLPVTGPMELYVGLIPTYGAHVSQGKFCSPCHTLITNTADLNGISTGATFIEQATYHEWLNSQYPAQQVTCQNCHMPQLEEEVIIANGNIALAPRAPFNLHQFAGANTFMLQLMKANKEKLNIPASNNNFDSTIALTYKMLQQALTFDVKYDTLLGDTAFFDLSITNKAGHKFPSGYPARRAFVEFIVTKENGDTIFQSGRMDNNYEVVGNNNPFEPHYNIISKPDQAQIYEMVMKDVNGNRTTVLERAADYMKDNRIPPKGFTTYSSVYDTTIITADALADPDFNKTNTIQGSGKDIVHYHVAMNGYDGKVNVSAKMYYQSVPPRWLAEMFLLNGARIDSFRHMYNEADKSPVLVSSDTLQNIFIATDIIQVKLEQGTEIFPNPVYGNTMFIACKGYIPDEISLYGLDGKLISSKLILASAISYQINLPERKGAYYIIIRDENRKILRKIIKL